MGLPATCGRCPLLVEHCRSLDAMVGQVVAAEFDGPLLRAMVRFAPVPEADQLWTLLQTDFPISLSIGATVQQADVVEEHHDCRVIRCGRWTLSEVSVCVYGRDPAAHLRKLNWDKHAGEIVERMQERAGGPSGQRSRVPCIWTDGAGGPCQLASGSLRIAAWSPNRFAMPSTSKSATIASA